MQVYFENAGYMAIGGLLAGVILAAAPWTARRRLRKWVAIGGGGAILLAGLIYMWLSLL